MRITARTEYAIRVVFELALERPSTLVPVRELAERTGAPLGSLGNVIQDLRIHGIIRCVRGQRGGVGLLVAPDKISVGDIIRLAGESSPLLGPGPAGPGCPPGTCTAAHGDSTLRDFWRGVQSALSDTLDTTTFAVLAARSGAVLPPG